jgi:C4-dicarboxylate-specific signal transduction histidine kinase
MISLQRSWPFSQRKISLTAQFSVLLVLAAMLPLLITLLGSYFILRPTLLSQAGVAMENDANSNARSLNSYLSKRSQDVAFLGQSSVIQQYLAGSRGLEHQALNQLVGGLQLDANYTTWTLFDARGNLLLSYPTAPKSHGLYLVPPSALQQLHNGNKVFFSDVYFDNVTSIPFIDIYTAINGTGGKLTGIGRATLNLTQVWNAVNTETNAGGYAMVVDGHGVRIAYTITNTLSPALFKGIAPFSPAFAQQIKDENLYGNTLSPVSVMADTSLANVLQNPQGSTVFTETPSLQNQSFQVARAPMQIVPWTYLVLRPVNAITAPANQQELLLFLLGIVVTVLAAFLGLMVSRGATSPILQAVARLTGNSRELKSLADVEQTMSTEQQWIIEGAQTGLNSAQYYAEATGVAAHKLDEIGNILLGNWGKMHPQQARKYLEELIVSAKYIEKATTFQKKSFQDLSSGIRVSTQVTKQLSTNSSKALESATLMEEVVEQLRDVVGQ